MDEASVNVESRTSSQDKRWTIMAALLGTNTAFMLFQGIEQERNYTAGRLTKGYPIPGPRRCTWYHGSAPTKALPG